MIRLTLTVEQAHIVSLATEFYARVRMGQFHEIHWHTMDIRGCDDFCDRRGEAERLLMLARKQIYPDLHGIGHSYGIGKFQDADRAFDVYQVIRYTLGDPRTPFSFSEPLPTCTVTEEKQK